MKLTVKSNNHTIIVDESDNTSTDGKCSIRYRDQKTYVHETIILMVDQIKTLTNL